jgi:class 3 adenylate cyclase
VKQLAEGTDAIAFAVQSASVGYVSVKLPHHGVTIEDPFRGIHKLYDLFDTWMVSFSQLSRVSVLADHYVFAGGVFTMTNKPEKHAEEATRFALKILTSGDEIRNAVGSGVSVFVGINTDGPLIGGVMNVQRPEFQLIGSAIELARGLAETTVVGQIHVTRSVYELIYSHNFQVTDRGDVALRNGRSVHAYVILP